VPIGETLAEARRQAGLTVAQVSQRTRIRQTIIRAIEDDDYASCGGDFYARGHIRSIAKAVGADSEPLIQEYDEHHRAKNAYATVSLDELLSVSAAGSRARGPDLSAVRGMSASAAAAVRRTAGSPALRRTASQARDRARRPNVTALLGLALALVFGLGVYLFVTRSQPVAGQTAAGQTAPASHAPVSHAAAHRPHRSGPSSAARASQRAATPAPAPAAASQPLIPVSATAFGPSGGDNPQLARLVLGGRGRGWRSDWYTSPSLGNLYAGTGLLLDMGRPVTITAARVTLGRAAGATLQFRVGAAPTLAGTQTVARVAGARGVVRLRPGSPVRGRYVIVWFTRLPPDQSGTFQAAVYHISLQGHT
jgi:transcriptional regulator with XRE-family HTH domain